MIRTDDVREIIAQYVKHGWSLRRVLLSQVPATDLIAVFGECPVIASEIDACWFSRRSNPESEAWELRRLTGSPFALIAVLDDAASDDERSDVLTDVEENMAAAASGPSSH